MGYSGVVSLDPTLCSSTSCLGSLSPTGKRDSKPDLTGLLVRIQLDYVHKFRHLAQRSLPQMLAPLFTLLPLPQPKGGGKKHTLPVPVPILGPVLLLSY